MGFVCLAIFKVIGYMDIQFTIFCPDIKFTVSGMHKILSHSEFRQTHTPAQSKLLEIWNNTFPPESVLGPPPSHSSPYTLRDSHCSDSLSATD